MAAGLSALSALVFDLFGTLVPELPVARRDRMFGAAIASLAEILGLLSG